MQVTSALLIVIASIYAVDALSSGAPEQACDTLSPDPTAHSNDPQDTPVPYNIDLSVFNDGTGSYVYVPGETYTLTISGNNGETFRGFFVQCRLVADDVTRVGVFADTDTNTRLSSCPIVTDGVTHVNTDTPRIEFTSRTMEWTAPAVDTGPVRFGYAVVEVRITYWANERSAVIQEAPPQPQPSSTVVVEPSETPDVESTADVVTPSMQPSQTPAVEPTESPDPTVETTESATGVFVSMVSLLAAVVAGNIIL